MLNLISKQMKHYVYSAAVCKKNKISNEAALRAINEIQMSWNLEHDNCGYYPDVQIYVTDDNENLSIMFESTGRSNSEFINACMRFAREHYRIKQLITEEVSS